MNDENKLQQDKNNHHRIINQMIRDYQQQIRFNKNMPRMSGVVQEDLEKVKFLQDLRDGKIEL